MRIFKIIMVVVGTLLTYGSGIAWLAENEMLGLPLPIWTMIGFTIFLIGGGISYWQLHSENKKLKSFDAEQERKKKKLEIEKLVAEKKSRENITLI